VLQSAPSWSTPPDARLEARFQRVKAKLIGYLDDPPDVIRKYPPSDRSVPAHYARAYAYHRGAYPDQAVAEVDALVATAPRDPYFLELKGQILLESGKPAAALAPLRAAVAEAPDQPLIASTFGHALIATEDPGNYEEARRVLRLAVARDNENPFAWYQLGIIYAHDGDQARAAMATAERYSLEGNMTLAGVNAEMALRGLPEHSADWLRAQDIAMAAKNQSKKRRR
jgi:predicted Zn-dependent protease